MRLVDDYFSEPYFWLFSGALFLSLGWLLPNHYWPWIAFHSDAWVALILSVTGLVVIARAQSTIRFPDLICIVCILIPAISLQYMFGVIPFAGIFFVGIAYILGFVLSVVVGFEWENQKPQQVGDFIFFAIGVAAIISVGFTLHQWLRLDSLEVWVMQPAEGARPFANFGQPNQLATLLLWGLLACAWGVARKKISLPVALLMSIYFLLGVALTESRTALVSIVLLVVATWIWRDFFSSKLVPWIVSFLALIFYLFVFNIQFFNDYFLLDHFASIGKRTAGEKRIFIYMLFLSGVLNKWLVGYGWNQGRLAQMDADAGRPLLNGLYEYSHNIFLDVVLWFGLPLGLLVSVAVGVFIVNVIKNISNIYNLLLLLLVFFVGFHAMVELPLHYAYFLFPVGLVVGSLSVCVKSIFNIRLKKRLVFLIYFSINILFFCIVRDYFIVEDNFNAFRFEKARIGFLKPKNPPDVWVLTQLRDFLKFARLEIKSGYNAEDLHWMNAVVGTYPSPGNMINIIHIFVLNGKYADAQRWVGRLRNISSENEYEVLKNIWIEKCKLDVELCKINWP